MCELPNNLRIDSKGKLYCEDGRRIGKYIRDSPLGQKCEFPIEVVVLSREDFFKLCDLATFVQTQIIQAA